MNTPSDAMVAYAPGATAAAGVLAVMTFQVFAGFATTHCRSRIPASILGLVALAATLYFVELEPAGFRMVAIVLTMLLAMKAIVASNLPVRLTLGQWLGFTLWPGMRPAIFTTLGSPPRQGAARLAKEGLLCCCAGIVFVAVARGLALLLSPSWARVCATPFLLVGFSLMLHFGFLNLLAAYWRTLGVAAERLFRDPLHATSLADFWSRRWNLAFTEMTAVVIHRPIRSLTGGRVAMLASFVASGLLHELAISVPSRGGYGLPTLYFVFHGILMLRNSKSRVVMVFALIAPVLLVFHLPFLRTVVWPLAGIR